MIALVADGTALLRAFARLASAACAPEAPAEAVLEAAAMGIALAVVGLVDRAPDRDRVASRARKVLLGAAALRSAAADEDARDATDLAIETARRGVALLGGGSPPATDASLGGAPTHEPTSGELARLLGGELDGFAAADVALRLHRSGARDRYAAFLPERLGEARVRLAADSAPVVRDPSLGRSLGTATLGSVALEAYAFEPDAIARDAIARDAIARDVIAPDVIGTGARIVAIYAEPAIGLSLVSIDAALASRARETAGYLELALAGDPERISVVLGDGDRTVGWTLALR